MKLKQSKKHRYIENSNKMPLGPRFMGSNLAKDDGFLQVIKIHSMTSFCWKVRPSAPCQKILQHLKEPCGVGKQYFVSKIMVIFSPCFPLLHYQVSLLVTVRGLWWIHKVDFNSDGEHTIDQQ
jgi:hypothetical protein